MCICRTWKQTGGGAIKIVQPKGSVLRSLPRLCQQCLRQIAFFFPFAIPITAGYRCFPSSSLFWENKSTNNSLQLLLVLEVTPLQLLLSQNITFFINCSFSQITGSVGANHIRLCLCHPAAGMLIIKSLYTHLTLITDCDDFLLPVKLQKSCFHNISPMEHLRCSLVLMSLQTLPLMACTELLLQIFLWDIYNTAEMLQVESLMNNGSTSVFICCVDTDTIAALLMFPRLSGEVAFFNLIVTNQ